MKRFLALLSVCLLAGCASRTAKVGPSFDSRPMPFFCWFVESGPAGEHGYAIGFGFLDSCCPPGGHKRFDTLEELRWELWPPGTLKVSVTPRYIQVVPAGWVIRPLTDEEAKFLQWQ